MAGFDSSGAIFPSPPSRPTVQACTPAPVLNANMPLRE